MVKIERFEDIEAWKQARILTNEIYTVSEIGKFSKDFSLKDQIRRASVSVMANIAEGFDTGTDKDFIRFLIISRRSATEIQSHLYVALDRNYIDKKQFSSLYEQVVSIKSLIYGFIRYLANKKT
jgi:four helix bundle protein